MLELPSDQQDLVTPILALMNEGKYDDARAALEAVGQQWRVACLWTIAAMTGICL